MNADQLKAWLRVETNCPARPCRAGQSGYALFAEINQRLESAGDAAVGAERLGSGGADSVIDFLRGGFAGKESLELRNDDFVHDGLGRSALLGGHTGGRRNDKANAAGGGGNVALVKAFGT